jgi:hypothetical protein
MVRRRPARFLTQHVISVAEYNTDGESLTKECADVPQCGASDQRSDLANDADDCDICRAHQDLIFEESWIEILAAVRTCIKTSH